MKELTQDEIKAILDAHALWLKGIDKGKRANLTDASLNIGMASPYVYDAIAAVLAAQMALRKTRLEWRKGGAE